MFPGKKYIIRINLIILAMFLFLLPLEARNPNENPVSGLLRVYIDGVDDYYQYFTDHIMFVNFVRDPEVSNIHVIISVEHTAGGGHKFHLRSIGRGEFEGQDEALFYNSIAQESDDQQRYGLTQILTMGLMPYLSQTSLAPYINIQYVKPDSQFTTSTVVDPWNYWVFSLDLGGGMASESSRNGFTVEGSVRADRITERFRTGLEFDYEYEEENISDENKGDILSVLDRKDFDAEVAKSLGGKWSAGLFSEIASTTYRNIELGISISPAIEYNVFPWNESFRHILSFAYYIGTRYQKYFEETIYNKVEETLFFHTIRAKSEMIQPWGELYVRLEGSQYLHDLSKNRLDIYMALSLRLTRGLSVVLNTGLESIHDQLYLPREGATLDEILLKRRQLATTYQFDISVGFRYTFGSIYHNIVNRRFED